MCDRVLATSQEQAGKQNIWPGFIDKVTHQIKNLSHIHSLLGKMLIPRGI